MSIGTTSGLKNLNNLAGGLASSAVSFAFTGNATFNILNLTDFGSRINGGLLEFTVGKDGISSKIGNGGTNISYSNIKSSISGASSLHKNSQINKTKYDKQTKDALRSQYGFGDKIAKKQLDSIINGDTILKFDADGSEVAQSINENGQKIIHINSTLNEGFIDLGLTLQHEAHRDGIISDKQGQYIETVNAVAGHTKMALAMTKDSLYTKEMLNHISSDTNLQNDINAYMYAAYTGNAGLFAGYVGASYDSSADYWKLVKQENGKYGIQYDGNHSLLDENGNIIIKNEMDEFDKNGNISGHKLISENSYAASLGMLMGTFTDYSKDYDSYYNGDIEENPLGVSKQILRDNAVLWQNGQYINTENIIDANPFLMTKIGIETGKGVKNISLGDYNLTLVSVQNEYNQSVGIIGNFDSKILGNSMTNFTTIENMVPEGQRLKAGTIKFENGSASIYGLASTMPDPSKMSKDYPALSDGTYYYAWSLHNPDSKNAYPAMRLFQSQPSSWNEITGYTNYPNFQIGTGSWGYLRDSFSAYYYNELGVKVYTTTDYINGHKTNYTYTNSSTSNAGFTGGSLGCQIWYPTTWEQMTLNFSFNYKPVYGTYTVNRELFGDGTNKKNNWMDENWW